MSRKDFVGELAERALLCDGAMGTQLIALGLSAGECGMLWNVERPEDVIGVHAAYRDAGCDLITTNSFGGTRTALDREGFGGRVRELNVAAARLAREAAGESRWVLGDVGPLGDFLEPVGDMPAEAAREVFAEQVAALVEGGADGIIVETMSDPAEVEAAVGAALGAGVRSVVATYAFQKTADGFRTMMGTGVEEAVARAVAAGAAVVGANCGTSLALGDYIVLAERLVAAAGGVPVIVQPNAGAPRMSSGAAVYDATPEEMALAVPPLLEAGVRVIGGCCGTTPAHLAAMNPVLRVDG